MIVSPLGAFTRLSAPAKPGWLCSAGINSSATIRCTSAHVWSVVRLRTSCAYTVAPLTGEVIVRLGASARTVAAPLSFSGVVLVREREGVGHGANDFFR